MPLAGGNGQGHREQMFRIHTRFANDGIASPDTWTRSRSRWDRGNGDETWVREKDMVTHRVYMYSPSVHAAYEQGPRTRLLCLSFRKQKTDRTDECGQARKELVQYPVLYSALPSGDEILRKRVIARMWSRRCKNCQLSKSSEKSYVWFQW